MTAARAMHGERLTDEQASAVYDVLVELAGAIDSTGRDQYDPRSDFVFGLTDGDRECQFQGALGSGGKFRNANGRWYVTAYPEGLTPARRQMIEATNEALARIQLYPSIT